MLGVSIGKGRDTHLSRLFPFSRGSKRGLKKRRSSDLEFLFKRIGINDKLKALFIKGRDGNGFARLKRQKVLQTNIPNIKR